jgi:hypothetical protein
MPVTSNAVNAEPAENADSAPAGQTEAEALKARVAELEAELKAKDAAAPAAIGPADELDVTSVLFTDADADERGWIVHYEPVNESGQRPYHRVPVAAWKSYEKSHGF